MTNPYEGYTLSELKAVIKRATRDHSIRGWDAPKGRLNSADLDRRIHEHVEHINEMCNEFGLVPGPDGFLVQSDN